ncbi:MAG TPA: lipoprotein [Gammaproteobacteria bacterium]|nr:lipoprotein [Gammaproteobacteria bacterium]
MLISFLLLGCGQSGKLYLPQETGEKYHDTEHPVL